MEQRDSVKKKKIIVGSIFILMAMAIIGISYALWTFNIAQEDINNITTSCLKLEMTGANAIDLKETTPLTDEEGMELTPYTFTIKNTCSTSVSYNVSLEMMEASDRLATKYVAIAIDDQKKQILGDLDETTPTYDKGDYTPVEGRLLLSGNLSGNESKSHNLRIWLDESVTINDDAMNKNFISKLVMNATINKVAKGYTEGILNGADPVLANNLIPVIIDNTGTVTKANINTEWYSYEKKNWANAVILEDESITYQEGEVIPEENIESYFVWIPRYKYKIWTNEKYSNLTEVTESKVQEIDIIFENKETPASTDTSVGSYYTHPAFIAMNTNGLWVGKFETGYKGANTTSEAEINEVKPDSLQIKPNVYSWRNIQVSNAHLTSYNYKRELDSHMMKNTEWGSVAYLTNSKYGRCTNGTCEEVRINNNSSYITGYAAKNAPAADQGAYVYSDHEATDLGIDGTKTYNYKNANSQVASTTGNYSGVYDMSGGAWEYVMGVMLDETNTAPLSGTNSTNNSGFKGNYGEGGSNTTGLDLPESKYYDTYSYSASHTDYSRYIYGDATGELGPFATRQYGSQTRTISSWNDDEGTFVSTKPWFGHGGSYEFGMQCGAFAFANAHGKSEVKWTFRMVLAI